MAKQKWLKKPCYSSISFSLPRTSLGITRALTQTHMHMHTHSRAFRKKVTRRCSHTHARGRQPRHQSFRLLMDILLLKLQLIQLTRWRLEWECKWVGGHFEASDDTLSIPYLIIFRQSVHLTALTQAGCAVSPRPAFARSIITAQRRYKSYPAWRFTRHQASLKSHYRL